MASLLDDYLQVRGTGHAARASCHGLGGALSRTRVSPASHVRARREPIDRQEGQRNE